MDFIDWRKAPESQKAKIEQQATNKYHGKRFDNYVEEQIREAEERGDFSNLIRAKPLDRAASSPPSASDAPSTPPSSAPPANTSKGCARSIARF